MGFLRRDASDQGTEGWGVPLVEVGCGGRGGDCGVSHFSEQFFDEVSGIQYVFPALDFPSICFIGQDFGLSCVVPNGSLGLIDVLKSPDRVPALDVQGVEGGWGMYVRILSTLSPLSLGVVGELLPMGESSVLRHMTSLASWSSGSSASCAVLMAMCGQLGVAVLFNKCRCG